MKQWSPRVRAPAPAPTRPPSGRPGPGADSGTVLRALVLGALVFVAAVVAAGLLAGAAPAGLPQPTHTSSSDAGGTVTVTSEPARAGRPDPVFAYSLIWSGATALALSIIGTVMVARRRRLW